jgi:hypothetical protein
MPDDTDPRRCRPAPRAAPYIALTRQLRVQVPGGGVSAVAWEGGSLRIALAVESPPHFPESGGFAPGLRASNNHVSA